jgi:very-short-patch-repair endonuclease
MLIIEVDGEQHGAPVAQANDTLRDDYFRSRGFRVLRVSSLELVGNRHGIHVLVEQALATTPPRGRRPPP